MYQDLKGMKSFLPYFLSMFKIPSSKSNSTSVIRSSGSLGGGVGGFFSRIFRSRWTRFSWLLIRSDSICIGSDASRCTISPPKAEDFFRLLHICKAHLRKFNRAWSFFYRASDNNSILMLQNEKKIPIIRKT